MLRLAVLFVLLTPCIDYVVTFMHLGKGDARLLWAATPALPIIPMMLLAVYLHLLAGSEVAGLMQPGPFLHAFVILIAIPLALAGTVQALASKARLGAGWPMDLAFCRFQPPLSSFSSSSRQSCRGSAMRRMPP